MTVGALFGGQSRTVQWEQLQTATIITATSGRLLDVLQFHRGNHHHHHQRLCHNNNDKSQLDNSNNGKLQEGNMEHNRDTSRRTTHDGFNPNKASVATATATTTTTVPSRPSTSFIVSRIPPHLIQTLHVCVEHKKMKKLLHTLDIIFPIPSQMTSNLVGSSLSSSSTTTQYV